MWTLIGILIFGVIAVLGCFVGFAYNILEYIFKRDFKWMHPIAGLLWVLGFYPFLVLVVIHLLTQHYT